MHTPQYCAHTHKLNKRTLATKMGFKLANRVFASGEFSPVCEWTRRAKTSCVHARVNQSLSNLAQSILLFVDIE